ncbi:MAG: hypothetical protein LBG12_11245, partial [Synergistaceae bacterium]|nr:hypothetical protein [Synergistaceae bacterium]
MAEAAETGTGKDSRDSALGEAEDVIAAMGEETNAADETTAAAGADRAMDAARVIEDASRRVEVITEGLLSDTPQAQEARDKAKDIERQAVEAGRPAEEAKVFSRLFASMGLRMSEQSGVSVRSVLDTLIRGMPFADWKQGVGDVLEQAMYRNSRSLDDFFDYAVNERNPGKKSFVTEITPDGVEVDIPDDTIRHDYGEEHKITAADWRAVIANMDAVESYVFDATNDDGTYPVLLKISADGRKYGEAIDHSRSGRNVIRTIFKGTDTSIDEWMKKAEARPPVVTPAAENESLHATGHSSLTDILTEMQNEINKQGDNQAFNQKSGKIPNAKIQPLGLWRSVITLFENANTSSLPHEFAHHALNVLVGLRGISGINEAFAADIDLALSELGVSRDDFLNDAELRSAAHEKFARLFEIYLETGKAPSKGLRETFKKIRAWMINVYRDIRQAFGMELSPEMQGFFDRLIATPEEIADNTVIGDLAVEDAATEERLAEIEGEIRAAETELRELGEAGEPGASVGGKQGGIYNQDGNEDFVVLLTDKKHSIDEADLDEFVTGPDGSSVLGRIDEKTAQSAGNATKALSIVISPAES